jgi:hypothetical protein
MTMPKPPPKKGAIIELDEEDFKGEVIVHKNLTQDVVLTTEDKLKLALIQHREVLISRSEWLGSATLALSFLSSLLLTNFKDIGPLTADTWRAVYLIFFLLAFARLLNVLYKMYVNRKKASVDYVIKMIKQSRGQDDKMEIHSDDD